MTDQTLQPITPDGRADADASRRRSDADRRRHTAKRMAAERRFKYAGLASIFVAAAFLVLLLSTVVGNGLPAFTSNNLKLSLDLSAENVDPTDPGKADYRSLINNALKEALPFVSGRSNTRAARKLISSGAPTIARQTILNNPDLVGQSQVIEVPLSDTVDLYLKGLSGDLVSSTPAGSVDISDVSGTVELTSGEAVFAPFVQQARDLLAINAQGLLSRAGGIQRSLDQSASRIAAAQAVLDDAGSTESAKARAARQIEDLTATIERLTAEKANFEARADALKARAQSVSGTEELTENDPSLFVEAAGGLIKITKAGNSGATGEVLVSLANAGTFDTGNWAVKVFEVPESERKISDREIAWTESLRSAGAIESGWNDIFFSRGASREPEMAGIWGAVVGSFLTLIVTLLLSFPIGVAAAIYLEEFAPKNRLTDLIEVNINNLAAVPSIVFGLLGLAVFINFAEFPRSAPLVGGMVLALMTLPTIIIASRAALKAVPPSIREAALGIGASRSQAVFHHVLPLAMPGMLTGTIIGMAQALGETAPLLMIGMVAFIVDIPGGFIDPATVLPVQIYMWADFPELAFQQKTAAAIMVLLVFLVLMNAIAVVLRKRFERRW
ncbi:MAG: phosphate ABC transporter permease PstA [Pseudomonadota bacterium]